MSRESFRYSEAIAELIIDVANNKWKQLGWSRLHEFLGALKSLIFNGNTSETKTEMQIEAFGLEVWFSNQFSLPLDCIKNLEWFRLHQLLCQF